RGTVASSTPAAISCAVIGPPRSRRAPPGDAWSPRWYGLNDRPLLRVVRCALAAALIVGCARRAAEDWATVREVTPAFLTGEIACDASLAADRQGHVVLTWVTGDSTGQDLWLALSADSGSTF